MKQSNCTVTIPRKEVIYIIKKHNREQRPDEVPVKLLQFLDDDVVDVFVELLTLN